MPVPARDKDTGVWQDCGNMKFSGIRFVSSGVGLSVRLALAASLSFAPLSRAEVTLNTPLKIGEVSFLLGKAWVIHDDQRERAYAGMILSAHDVIETSSNAHVHIRFVDNALVSVRPSSRLEIIRYDFLEDAPNESAVKFNLKDGVTRAISGEIAKRAKSNFRMNTPIAAIGVRGTDFVVSASDESTSAIVNEGAIIVAPFSSDCSAETLGPCSSNALELTGGASQFLQLTANTEAPILLPLPGSDIPEALMASAQVDDADPEAVETNDQGGKEKLAETVTVRAVNLKLADNAPNAAVKPVPVVPDPESEPLPEFTPDIAVASAELTERQLVWGRFSENRLDNERISTAFELARAGRATTVANNQYALFRTEFDTQLVKPDLGVMGFELDQAQAVFTGATGSSLMYVHDGELSLDFNLNRYYTSLSLGHVQTGEVGFTDSGRIFGGGYFHSDDVSASSSLAGAVSLDGTEAGYLFKKLLETGRIDGLTLWSAAP
jgi:hypothetical protein